MNNLIMCAFAFPEGHGQSTQIENVSDAKKIDIYIENAYVALVSAKLHNPNDTVVFVTDRALEAHIQKMFQDAGIENVIVPFDCFLMPDDFMWSRAFYKLCVLYHIAKEKEFNNLLLLDTDTYSVQNYEELWMECGQGVLLYEVGHTFYHRDREVIYKDYKWLYGPNHKPIHYGGEFVAGNRDALCTFMEECIRVYTDMKEAQFQGEKNAGDETILSIAACKTSNVIPANPYLFRFWTGDFYLVSTLHEANPVCIWHLPAEKDMGMRYMYRYYQRKKCFPEKKKAAKIMGLPEARRKRSILHFWMRIRKKIWA